MVVLAIIAVIVVVIVAALFSVMSWYKTASPNEALIITGGGAMRIIPGGGGVALPFINKHAFLNMSSRQIPIHVKSALTQDGIEINVRAVAMIKVGSETEQIRAAAQRFQGDQDRIKDSAIEVLTGSLRGIVAEQTAVTIYQDRVSLTQAVMNVTKSDLEVQGLVLDTLQIQEIDSASTYYQDIGRAELAAKKKEAEIAEARANQEAKIAEARANQEAKQADYLAQLKVSEAERDYEIQKAKFFEEREVARTESEAAGPLALAETDRQLFEKRQLAVIAKAEWADRRLDVEVRKPADAARYKAEQEAEARKTAAILDAEAKKEAAIRDAEAQAERDTRLGEADKAARVARADALQREGEAEAAALAAKGAAEAQAIAMRAEALAKMDESGKLQMQLEVLPRLVEAAAAPMGRIGNLTVLSTEGASALPKAALTNITQLTTMFPQLAEVIGALGSAQPGAAADTAAGDGTGTNKG